ncbi:hypothetical protein PMAYCL1PPCAC_32100, partial [Pristionchus mayeri]
FRNNPSRRFPSRKYSRLRLCWRAGSRHLICSLQFIGVFPHHHFTDSIRFDFAGVGLLFLVYSFRICGGIASDSIKCMSETRKLQLFNSLALMAPAIYFIGIQFTSDNAYIKIILFISACFLGFCSSGFYKCITLHTRHHGHFVMIMASYY